MPGGAFDGDPQGFRAQRREDVDAASDRCSDPRQLGRAIEEVRSDREDDHAACVEESGRDLTELSCLTCRSLHELLGLVDRHNADATFDRAAERPDAARTRAKHCDLVPGRGEPGNESGEENRGLAAARGSRDGEHRAGVRALDERLDVRVASEEEVGILAVERLEPRIGTLARSIPLHIHGCDVGILAQDRRLEIAKPRAHIDAELVEQPAASGSHGGEGIGLAPCAIVRQCQDRPPVLAQRVRSHQPFCVGDDLAMLAGVEPGIQPLLFGTRADLDEAKRLDDRGVP